MQFLEFAHGTSLFFHVLDHASTSFQLKEALHLQPSLNQQLHHIINRKLPLKFSPFHALLYSVIFTTLAFLHVTNSASIALYLYN